MCESIKPCRRLYRPFCPFTPSIRLLPKTDADAQGRLAYLSRETVRWLKIWLEHARIDDGAVFRRLIGQNQVGGALNPGSIAPIFKRVAA